MEICITIPEWGALKSFHKKRIADSVNYPLHVTHSCNSNIYIYINTPLLTYHPFTPFTAGVHLLNLVLGDVRHSNFLG
jgi:hypothetical protein